MKNRMISCIMTILTCFMLVFTACKSQINVTFKQDGEKDIIITLNSGESINEIPQPVQKPGYTIAWDKNDFNNIKSSMIVNAVSTANTYTIIYEIDNKVTGIQSEQSVVYGEDFELAIPKKDGKVFVNWTLKGTKTNVENGKYIWTEDITLTPNWDIDNKDEYSYVY